MIEKMDKTDEQDTLRAIRDGNEDCIPDEVIDKMVYRFLGWTLPKSFNPDNHIIFEKDKLHPAVWPSGTNLLDFDQAKSMVRHMLNL